MAKTTVQQLIEWCEYRRGKSATIHNASWNMIIAEIKDKYIETDKQQKIDAWKNGYMDGLKDGLSDDLSDNTAEKYYEETYKQD